jgi:hypothetical protein
VSDIFQEVEEEVRRERYERLWKDYGNHIIAVCSLIIQSVAGFQAWRAYELGQRQEFATRFIAASQSAATGDAAAAERAFTALVPDAPSGYESLAKFRIVNAQLAQNKRDAAIAGLRALTEVSDPLLSAAARLRLAWLLADTAPRAEINTLIAPLAAENSAWRFSAQELTAYLDLKGGKRNEALAAYTKLAADANASDDLRQRANMIAQYLRANPEVQNPAALPALTPSATPTPPAPAQETPTP